MVKFWKSGLKLLIIGKKKYFYRYCSTYTLKFFATDIWYSPLLFTNVVLIDSPTYLRTTFAWTPCYHHITSNYLRDPRSDKPNRLLTWGKSFQLIIRSVLTWVAEVIAGNVVITWWSREGKSVNLWGKRLQR